MLPAGFLRRNRDIIRAGVVFVVLAGGSIFGLSANAMQHVPAKSFTATIAAKKKCFNLNPCRLTHQRAT